MKAELVPDDGGPPIPIIRDVTVIGRREFCDIQLDHPSLSKRHAILVKTDGLLILRDLISTNGTKVKGQRIRWAALLPDDRITLGSLKFTVYLGPDNTPGPSERPRSKQAVEPKPPKASNGAAPPEPRSVPRARGTANLDIKVDPADWRTSGSPRPTSQPFPIQINEDELNIEADDDAIIDLD